MGGEQGGKHGVAFWLRVFRGRSWWLLCRRAWLIRSGELCFRFCTRQKRKLFACFSSGTSTSMRQVSPGTTSPPVRWFSVFEGQDDTIGAIVLPLQRVEAWVDGCTAWNRGKAATEVRYLQEPMLPL